MENSVNKKDFQDRVAIITGGASGIGKALAENLAQRGCKVVIADLQIELAEESAAAIKKNGGIAEAVKVDVTRFAEMDALVRETVEQRGRIDYFFNNAGIGTGGEVRHFTIEDWDRIIDINLRSVANGVQAVYNVMIRQGFGHIVNTASMAGLGPTPLSVAYSATKHGVVGLSKALRAEAAAYGIRVSVICPGVVRTPILSGGKYGKMVMPVPEDRLRQAWERLRPMPPEAFAPKAIRGILRNKAIIIVPAWWKLAWYLHRISPGLGIYLAHRAFLDARKTLGLDKTGA